MLDYRIRIRLLAPLGTPWQSDTVFGHLVWQAALGRGDLGAEELLRPFREGRPPFVLSDGFPEGLLPWPMLPPPEASQDNRTQGVSDYALAKRRRKARWMTVEDFGRLCRGQAETADPPENPWREVSTLHASLDRRNGRTGGEGGAGQLFETEAWVLNPPRRSLEMYLRAGDEAWARRVENLLRETARAGFGRDKSVGLGAFAVEGLEPCDLFAPLSEADGFVSLSSFVPAPGDPVRGRWRLRVKRGKLGEPTAATANPFKRPLVELEPGAVFWLEGPARPWYGRLIEGLAPARPEAVQAAYTLPAPCRLPPGGAG